VVRRFVGCKYIPGVAPALSSATVIAEIIPISLSSEKTFKQLEGLLGVVYQEHINTGAGILKKNVIRLFRPIPLTTGPPR